VGLRRNLPHQRLVPILLLLMSLAFGSMAHARGATFNGFLSTLPITGLQAYRIKVDSSGEFYLCDANTNKVYKERSRETPTP
jgi:hypothetical protein